MKWPYHKKDPLQYNDKKLCTNYKRNSVYQKLPDTNKVQMKNAAVLTTQDVEIMYNTKIKTPIFRHRK